MTGGAAKQADDAGTAVAQPVPEPQGTAEQASSHSSHSTPAGMPGAPAAMTGPRPAATKATSSSKAATARSKSGSSWQGAAVKLLLAAASAATLSWLFNKRHARNHPDPKTAAMEQPPEPEATLPVLVDVHNLPRQPEGVAAAQGPLAGVTCVVADNVDVQVGLRKAVQRQAQPPVYKACLADGHTSVRGCGCAAAVGTVAAGGAGGTGTAAGPAVPPCHVCGLGTNLQQLAKSSAAAQGCCLLYTACASSLAAAAVSSPPPNTHTPLNPHCLGPSTWPGCRVG